VVLVTTVVDVCCGTTLNGLKESFTNSTVVVFVEVGGAVEVVEVTG